jgi:hypothetical protein
MWEPLVELVGGYLRWDEPAPCPLILSCAKGFRCVFLGIGDVEVDSLSFSGEEIVGGHSTIV